MSNTEVVHDQLSVLHNPFSGATAQPKIPDGKASTSLGFSLQNVKEYSNNAGELTLHFILYAGQASGLGVWGIRGAQKGVSARDYDVLGFTEGGGLDWELIETGLGSSITQKDGYALHRVVSCGLQMNLLNPNDENDGWWEAIRVNKLFEEDNYYCTTTVPDYTSTHTGTIMPDAEQMGLFSQDLVNDPTYSTGLVKDIGNVQFNLNGRLDYHDYRIMEANLNLGAAGTDYSTPSTTANHFRFLENDTQNAKAVIDQAIDPSYDMIYIRVHCRDNTTESEEFNGTRLHCNLISNQEVYFNVGQRDNRYHTPSYNIGDDTCQLHMHARRANFKAAHLIGS